MSAHNTLGVWGEHYVAAKLATIAPIEPARRADLRWLGVEIEVKTARATRSPQHRALRWQFCLHRQGRAGLQADVVILVLAETERCYIIPATRLHGQRKICIGSRPNQFTDYAEKWETLADLIAETPGVANEN